MACRLRGQEGARAALQLVMHIRSSSAGRDGRHGLHQYRIRHGESGKFRKTHEVVHHGDESNPAEKEIWGGENLIGDGVGVASDESCDSCTGTAGSDGGEGRERDWRRIERV